MDKALGPVARKGRRRRRRLRRLAEARQGQEPATATAKPVTASQPRPVRVVSPSQATPTAAGPIVSPRTMPAVAVVTEPR